MMKEIVLFFLFLSFVCFAQNDDIKISTNQIEINAFKQEEKKIIVSQINISEKEIFRMLEAAIIYGNSYKGQSVFYVNIFEQEKGFKASFFQAENFDFFPTNKQNLVGYIQYKKVYFFIFSSDKTSFFFPSNKMKEFVVKKTFSCDIQPTKNYEFLEGKVYQIEYWLGNEYKKPLKIWVDDIDRQQY